MTQFNEKWLCKLAQVIFKMHQSGCSYEEALATVTEMRRRLTLMSYTEEWMKEFNPKGLRYIR